MVALRSELLMGGIQMQTKYKIYTTYILKSSCLIGETCPERGWEVLAKGKYEMCMSFKHTRTSMNKDNREHMYQGTWKGFGT
jgi:hypothetical protein